MNADWSSYILKLSLIGGNILSIMVFLLSFLLIAFKFLSKLFERYKASRQKVLIGLVRSFLDTGGNAAKSALTGLPRIDRAVLKALLLQISEGLSRANQPRAAELYEAGGLAAGDIRALNHSGLWWIRAEAAHSLGQMRIKNAKENLLLALDDGNTEVRLESTWALGRLGFVDTLPRIIKSMAHYFKIAALRMDAFIFEMGAPALPLLLDICRHPESEVGLLAIHLVGEFRDPSALGVLSALLKSPELEIRLAACKAIGTIGDKPGLAAAALCVNDEAWQMRAQVAKQLGQNRYVAAIPGLAKGLEDLAWWVRFNTGEALSAMGEAGKRALEDALKSQDRFARDMAMQWLDEMKTDAP